MAATECAPDPRIRQSWGTIIEPPFPLGKQIPDSSAQVMEISERLHTAETKSRNVYLKPSNDKPERGGNKPRDEVQAIVERLSIMTKPPPESKRIGATDEAGILNTYAWKGWKTSDALHQQ